MSSPSLPGPGVIHHPGTRGETSGVPQKKAPRQCAIPLSQFKVLGEGDFCGLGSGKLRPYTVFRFKCNRYNL